MTAEEMTKAINDAIKSEPDMASEEQIEDDAEYGYFQDDEENCGFASEH